MTQPRTAFVTGITGQDGSYLAELLLGRGYRVHGLVRDPDSSAARRLRELVPHAADRLHLHQGDLSAAKAPAEALEELVVRLRPREIYSLGAQSHVRRSFDEAAQTLDVNAFGVLRLLEAARRLKASGIETRFFQAASSEIYDGNPSGPLSEESPFAPCSPYGCAKVCALHLVQTYRQAYGLFACNGILFNHESPRRGETFVTRKITRAATRIADGLQDVLELGNIDVARDWGYAPEYVDAIWLMLQQDTAEDFVVATGRAHTLREFLEIAFGHLGLDWRAHVRIASGLKRPQDVSRVVGDASKIRRRLGWRPQVSFDQLVRLMVDADQDIATHEREQRALPAA